MELNDLDKAIKNNNIEYFRGLRHSAKGMIGDSKYDSQAVIDWRKDFFISKGLNPDDYPFE